MADDKKNIYPIARNKRKKKASSNTTLESLTSEVKKLRGLHKKTCEMAARAILKALDCRDHYTFGHSTRVAFNCLTLGKELGLSKEELYNLELAALFHDIGKIGIPDKILLKPQRLDPEEYKIMKSHPVKSYEILQDFTEFQQIANCAKHHHERFDGKGYPDRLRGETIPLFSRIILISDTFDAMTSTRTYRNGLDYDKVYNELKKYAGTQFDPKLVEHFINAIEKDMEKHEKTFSLKIIAGDFLKKDAA